MDYEQLLKSLMETSPRLAEMLRLAHRRRCLVLDDDGTPGVHFQGIEDFLAYLDRVDAALAERDDQSRRVSAFRLLIQRAMADFETATEAVCSVFFGVTFESMRDVMEISYLLRDFTYELDSIDAWLDLPDRKRQQRFSPNALRQRHAARLGIRPEDLPDTGEYRLHSSFVHVDPYFALPDIFVKGPPHKGQGSVGLIFSFGEIFHHAAHLLFQLDELAALIAPGLVDIPDLQDAFPAFKKTFLLSQKHTDIMTLAKQAWRETHDPKRVGTAIAEAIKTS